MREPLYRVVWPLGKLAYQTPPLAPRLSDLKGKTLGELSDYRFRAEEIFPMIRELLRKRYPGIKFVEYSVFGNTHSPKEEEVIAALPDLLYKHGCNTVISGIGA